ncbi:EIIABC-Fru [Anaerohalosphaera lusitana]|uniref:EIIABC-Fru n=1 Tax=Anaerohalosphaera lusitana TaxID=1936003 RepID=A0A1U9NM44_9BACT|nr:PTS sugar transporter subunit IIA [Anaerohalosphaera lusitana]AQT68877.1 EIIABC-Fru [Anaerohalosphaera lusitana]
MKLKDFICFDAIVPELDSNDRDAVISELVNSLEKAGKTQGIPVDELIEAVIKRENEASTGIGKGIAVPHVKHSGIKKLVGTIGCSSAGVDFSALDKQPTYSVMLLLSPAEDPDRHLQAMECIFKNLQNDDFRKFLRQAQTAEKIKEVVEDVGGK